MNIRRILTKLTPLLLLQILFSFLFSLTVAAFPLIEKQLIDILEWSLHADGVVTGSYLV